MYVRFMFTLGVGLAGVAVVLTVILESLFHEWDAARDISRFWRGLTHGRPHVADVSAEDILLELEKGRVEGRYQRRAPAKSIDRRREALRELREAEQRMSSTLDPELV